MSFAAHADVLVRKDGCRIEGNVIAQDADKVRIATRMGELEFARNAVDSIEKGKTRAQEFAAHEARAKTANDWFELGRWAAKQTLVTESKRCMSRAIELEPDHEGAHAALGQVRYKGAWSTAQERDARAKSDEAAEMIARGLVLYRDRWVTPEEREHLENGMVLEQGQWMTAPEAMRARGLEEFRGEWLPRAQVVARNDALLVEKLAGVPLAVMTTDDALLAGSTSRALLAETAAGLKHGRAWFDATFQVPAGLELFGGHLAELYVFTTDAPYLATIAHFASLTKTLPEGWASAVADTHGFFWSDPYPLSCARQWQRPEEHLIGHCYHHWGHLLASRLGYDGRLLPPWYEEGIASDLEFEVHQKNEVFCVGHADAAESGPSTRDPGERRPGTGQSGKDNRPPLGPDFDPKSLGEGRWRTGMTQVLRTGHVPFFERLMTLQFDELEKGDIAVAMAIVEWLASRGGLRAFHDELRKAAPALPLRVIPDAYMREACYERAFRAAVGLGWKDADKAWRSWFTSR